MSSLIENRLVAAALSRALGPGAAQTEPVPEPLSATEYDMVQVDAGQIWISHRDEVMRPYMQRAGCWEPDEGRLLRSLARPGCRFLDVGANVGYFSVLIGRTVAGAAVAAVEPDPDNVRALRFNLWANRVRGDVWPVALDDRDRALELSGNAHNLGDLRSGRVTATELDVDPGITTENRAQATKTAAAATTATTWTVPAASGRDLFPDRVFDLVKIDVQGWEFPVLIGLDEVLRRAPVAVVSEFWPAPLRATGREPEEVLAHYRELGYRIRTQVGAELKTLSDAETVAVCDTAGIDGQVNLLLER